VQVAPVPVVAALLALVLRLPGSLGQGACGGVFHQAVGSQLPGELESHLFRYGPPIGNVSSTKVGGGLITLSIPVGDSGMGGKSFWVTAKSGGECGLTGQQASTLDYTFFQLNCTVHGWCTGAVPHGPVLDGLSCPVLDSSTGATTFTILGKPSSRTAAAMYCAKWGPSIPASVEVNRVALAYLQLQAQRIYQLELRIDATANGGPGQAGDTTTYTTQQQLNTVTLIASIALVLAALHCLREVHTIAMARRRRNSAKTRQYLQLDSLESDEYDVQRLDDTADGF
jgi:hypothetical protein